MGAQRTVQGKVALVTGAARRIGAAIAAALHREGADVAIHFRGSGGDASALVETMNAQRADSAMAIQADLSDIGSHPAILRRIVDWRGRLDVLINNASSFYPTPVGEISEEHWDDLIGSNLKAPLFLSQASVSELRKTHGAIVNIVDIHARRPLRDYAVYGAAKAGLAMLTRSLAKDLAPDIRVNGVAPGAILWPEHDMSDATRKTILAQIPLGRAGDPDDVAACVLFLVRDADYVTGQIISVDGGRSIGW